MKYAFLLFALASVISVSAHASVPTSPVMPTRVQLSNLSTKPPMTAKAMDDVKAVPVVKGVTLISGTEAASTRGQGFFSSLWKAIVNWFVGYVTDAAVKYVTQKRRRCNWQRRRCDQSSRLRLRHWQPRKDGSILNAHAETLRKFYILETTKFLCGVA